MTAKPKAAGRGDGQAAHQNALAGRAKHSMRLADPITFYLPVDDRFRPSADERCWRVEQRRKDGEWRPVEYHSKLETAANSLSGRLLRTSDVRCLADALAAIDRISRTLTRALAPHFKVERQ
jgi:hypothetical protein